LNLKNILPSAVKEALFTSDDPPSAPAAPVAPRVAASGTFQQIHPTTAALAPALAGSGGSGAIGSGTDILAGGDSESLARFASLLRSRTDFDSTPIGQQLQEHLAPLEGLEITEQQRLGAALKAGAKDGLTGDAILATYTQLQAALEQENQSFQKALASATRAEVEDCRAEIAHRAETIKDLEAQIAAIREEQSRMSADMIAAQTRIAERKAQFQAAYTARKTELESAAARYQFLKGSAAHVAQPVTA
jgi:hypothetical protein